MTAPIDIKTATEARCEDCGNVYSVNELGSPRTPEPFTCDVCGGYVGAEVVWPPALLSPPVPEDLDRHAHAFLCGWLASGLDDATLDVELERLDARDTDPVRNRAAELLRAIRDSRHQRAAS